MGKKLFIFDYFIGCVNFKYLKINLESTINFQLKSISGVKKVASSAIHLTKANDNLISLIVRNILFGLLEPIYSFRFIL